jgi:aspartyl-tRNA(Asn)/glutamyl-tRNA(Gln) amidotransferase subunit B
MNSFRAVERALDYEAQRQYEVWRETRQEIGDVPKQTRGWDDQEQITRPQRHKEESSDYRYFPDPDLAPVTATADKIADVRESLGELPPDLRHRLEVTYGIKTYDSDVLVNQGRALVDYYVDVAERSGDGQTAANWVTQDVLRVMNDRQMAIQDFPIRPPAVADLIKRVKAGDFETSKARVIFTEMLESGHSAEAVIAAKGIRKLDDSELVALCEELLAANPRIVADVKNGKEQAAAGLIGQAKKRNPNVNPARVKEICLELIGRM